MSDKWAQPQDVDKLTMVFGCGGDFAKLLPPYAEIPEEFRRGHGKWNDFMSTWFFKGLKGATITPKDGVDLGKALRHLKAIIGSFEPAHEHKEAAVAYLSSLWLEDYVLGAESSR